MYQTLIALALCTFLPQQDRSDAMLHLATADQPLVNTVIVNAPVKDVWQAWSTTDGIKSWMVPEGEMVLKVGGYFRTSYTKGSDLKGSDTIENTILAFDPERMLAFRTSKTPQSFLWKTAMASAWTVIYLEPVGDSQTKVICRMNGYSSDPESLEMKKFFRQGNQATLEALAKKFER